MSSSSSPSSSSSSSSSPGYPESGLVPPLAYYPAQEASGDLVDIVGSLDFAEEGTPGSGAGKCNQGRTLSSGNQFFRSDDPIFNPGLASPLSILMWFKPDSTSTSILLEKTNEYQLELQSGKLVFRIATGSSSGWDEEVEFSTTFSTSTWYQVLAWIVPGYAIGLSVNGGTPQWTYLASGQAAWDGGNDIWLGHSESEGGADFDGTIDEIGFFDVYFSDEARFALWYFGDGQFYHPGFGAYPYWYGCIPISSSSPSGSSYTPPTSSSSLSSPSSSSSSPSPSSSMSSSPPPESSSSGEVVSSQSSDEESSSSSGPDPCNGNTFQVREKLTELPVVGTGQNGTGGQFREREVFDSFGRRIWTMDARGFIVRFIYDLATGAMVRRIDDVDTDLVDGVPPGWSTPEGGGLHAVTDYQSDDQGRTLRVFGPAHEALLPVGDCGAEAVWLRTVQSTVYRDDIRETWSANGYARGTGPDYTFVTVGTVKIARRDFDGRTTDRIEATRSCPCGPLSSAETFPQTRWRKWTHLIHDNWGRLQISRVYHRIPESGIGEEGENYQQTRFGYDSMGRQNRVVSPGGTITRTVFDSRGMPVERWVGTDDNGATDSDPGGGGAPGNNLVPVLINQYDHGADGGDGNLTKATRPVDDEESHDRVVENSFDFRNRLEETLTTDGTRDFISRNIHDNLDRVTGLETYHTAVDSGNLTSRSLTRYDSRGRVYRNEICGVDPETGAVGHSLTGDQWYDAAGNVVRGISPGSNAISAFSFDGLGRQTLHYLACHPPGSSSSSPSSSSLESSSESSGSSSPGSSSSSSSSSPGSSSPSHSSHSGGSGSSLPAPSSSSSSSSEGPVPNPSAYYNCERASGFLDDVVGALDFNEIGSSGSTSGKCNQARVFGGADYFQSSSDWVFNPGADAPLVILFWMKASDLSGTHALLEKAGEYQLLLESDKVIFKIATGGGTGWNKTVEFAETFNTVDWFRIVAWVLPGSEIGITVDNGVPETEALSSGQRAHTGAGMVYLGSSPSSGGDNFEGAIDEMAVFNAALTPDHLAELYDGGDGLFWNPETSEWGACVPPSSSSSSPSSPSSSSPYEPPPEPPQGNDNSQCEDNTSPTSGNPIRLSNGQIQLTETDLGANGFGTSWRHTRSYANLLSNNASGVNGNSWLQGELAYLVFDTGESGENIVLVETGSAYVWFQPDGEGGWEPQFTSRDSLVHDLLQEEIIVTRPDGRRLVFFDDSATHAAALVGRLKSVADPYGTAVTISYDGDFQVSRVVQTDGIQSGAWRYSYVPSGDNQGQLRSVTLLVNGREVRRAVYDYFGDEEEGGNLNDLKRVTIAEAGDPVGGWRTIRQKAYRYYRTGETGGFAHGLKFELGSESYALMTAAGIDPLGATDAVWANYADKYFEFDSAHRVALESIRGGQETWTYTYDLNPEAPGFADYNIWHSRTVETRPDGTERTLYANRAGSAILDKLSDTTTDEAWFHHTRYNDQGRPLLKASPSAVASVSEPSGGDATLLVALHSDAGLIDVTSYYTATNVPFGEIATYPATSGVQEGEAGSAMVTRSFTYATHTVGGVSIHPTASVTVYPVAGGAGDTTRYRHCWFDTLDPERGFFGYLPIPPDNGADVSDLIVVEQGQTDYNPASLGILFTSWERLNDATGTGPLHGPNDAQPRARRSYTASWHDGIGRSVAVADYGTHGGAALVRPALPPARSDTVLVTGTRHSEDGDAAASIDPMGIKTRWDNDAAGRRVRLIENARACGGGPDARRTTEFAYNADGQLDRLTLINGATGNQVTRWLFGTTLADSGVARNDLVSGKVWPTGESETLAYNRQGNVTRRTDPNGSVRQFTYDKLGQPIDDAATTVADGVDGTMRRVSTAYNDRGQRDTVTTYDAPTGGTVINQVKFGYDAFGLMIADEQEHDGTVDGSTPSVTYENTDGSGNVLRRLSITAPGGKQVDYRYGTTGGLDDVFNRVSSLRVNGESNNLVEYAYAGLRRHVTLAYPVPNAVLSYLQPGGVPGTGDAGDPMTGYDRFGRTTRMPWKKGSTVLADIAYGYDRNSRRTWRQDLTPASDAAFDRAYGYDGLGQVKAADRGTLNENRTAIGGIPQEAEAWIYDEQGNWLAYDKAEDGTAVIDQTRRSNQSNQIVAIDGSSDGVRYDDNGNMVRIPTGEALTGSPRKLVWNAWDQLVEVRDLDTNDLIQRNSYDGLFRRTTRTLADDTVIHCYYNDLWRPVEERLDASTDPLNVYYWGARPGHRDDLIRRDRDTDGNGTLDETLWCLMDYFDPIAILESSGSVEERYSYSAFGVPLNLAPDYLARSISDFDWDFLFHGQFTDAETEYQNYGFRYYQPETGRWLGRDPVGEFGGMNLYGFVGNNGVGQVDYLGLFDPGIPYLPDGVQPWDKPNPAEAAARNAINDFLNGTPDTNRHYGAGHPWTHAMQQHEHMDSIRNEIKEIICKYCSSDGVLSTELIGVPQPRPFTLNKLTWEANARIYLRDILAYAGFGSPVHGTGSVDFTFVIESISCSNNRNASVSFNAYDYLTISSATRIPRTNDTIMDKFFQMASGMAAADLDWSTANELQKIADRPLRDWDNNSRNSHGNTIFLHWSWDETIYE